MDSYISGVNSLYTNGSYTNSTTSSIENKVSNTDLTTATDDELMEVCKDFEAYFLEQMLKSMVKMADVDGETENNNIYSALFGMSEDSDAGMSTLSSYFGDELVANMAEQITEAQGGNGLGLAQTLYEQMKRNYGISSVSESVESADSTDIAAVEEL